MDPEVSPVFAKIGLLIDTIRVVLYTIGTEALREERKHGESIDGLTLPDHAVGHIFNECMHTLVQLSHLPPSFFYHQIHQMASQALDMEAAYNTMNAAQEEPPDENVDVPSVFLDFFDDMDD